MANSIRRNITFELPTEALKALKDDAEIRGVDSFHIRAHEIIIDYLSNRELVDLRGQVATLDADIAYLGELLRKVEFSIIVHAAGKSSKEANEWIREHMPSNANR